MPGEDLAGLEHGPQINRQHAVPVGIRGIEERGAGIDPGTVDQDVGAAGLLEGRGQQVFDGLPRGDVDRGETGLTAQVSQMVDAGLAAFFGQVADDDVRAGLGQAGTERPAQHARAADDHGRLTAEAE